MRRNTVKNYKYLYKNNVYTFFFLNEINKYISVQGLVLKSCTINPVGSKQYISLGKRLIFGTKISSEYTLFQIPICLPGLYV